MLTPERRREIARWVQRDDCGVTTRNMVFELLAEIDRLEKQVRTLRDWYGSAHAELTYRGTNGPYPEPDTLALRK